MGNVGGVAVSILVFLDQALKGGLGQVDGPALGVSILVFLDQALKEITIRFSPK